MILEFEWVTLGWSKMVAFQQSGRETVTPSTKVSATDVAGDGHDGDGNTGH